MTARDGFWTPERIERLWAGAFVDPPGPTPVGVCPECDAGPAEKHSEACLENTTGSKRVRA